MNRFRAVTRRRFVQDASVSIGAALGATFIPLPVWARGAQTSPASRTYTDTYNLRIGPAAVVINGRDATAVGINGTVPGPLLRLKEGRPITLNVTNGLTEDSSLHWHGLLLPPGMDGVPGISFDGIAPGETFRYEFAVAQSGTYWYHSHSGLQEQSGVYGPIIIDPFEADPVDYDREFIVFLSDWTFEEAETLFRKLKKMDDYYNYQRRTASDFFRDVSQNGWGATIEERKMWGAMRMSATDIADVTGAGYTYLMNGHDPERNWTGLFKAGDKVRLRVINGSAMSFFNVRIPGLAMTVVQADGQNIQPVETDEFQIGVAETYDVVVEPVADRAYTIFAESMDRSGFARGTLAPAAGMSADVPPLRERPLLTMADMGMQHEMGSAPSAEQEPASHAGMTHDMSADMQPQQHHHRRGPGVASVTEYARERLDDPGTGLENVAHRTLTYRQLKRLTPGVDTRPPERTLELHLTGNMARYMWSLDGVRYSEVDEPIIFRHRERLRMVLVNDTMMAHPMHLHGMFVELVNGNGARNPLKHTVVVKPAERLALDITAEPSGDWAFHCHLLLHMKAGMMQAVSVRPESAELT